MVSYIKNSNYSSLEKYIAVYNIVKKFKKYLENRYDKTESRYIKKFLNNDYMVCVEYVTLLKELLKMVGINSYDYHVSADISYDNGFKLEDKTVDLVVHARLIVSINDPKYNINGFYVSDPTWDNDLEIDYYNHALMSFDKTSKGKRLFALSDEDLIKNVKNMNEFNSKVNYLLDRLKRNNPNEKRAETNALEALVKF